MALIDCFGKSKSFKEDEILHFAKRSEEFQKEGLTKKEADIKAIQEAMGEVKDTMKSVYEQVGKPFDSPPEKPRITVSTPNIVNVKLKGQAEGAEPPPPPVDVNIPLAEEGKLGRLAHADTEMLYKEMGLGERIPRDVKKDTQLMQEADDLIKNGFDFMGAAAKVLSREHNLSDAEQVAFAKAASALKERQNSTPITSPEFDKLQHQIEYLGRASDVSGSESGGALRARQLYVPIDESISDFVLREKESAQISELTDAQKAKVQEEYAKISKIKNDLEAKNAQLQEELTKAKAEKAYTKLRGERPKTKRTHEDFVKERSTLVEQLKKQKAEHEAAMKNNGVQQMGGIPGLVLTPEMAKTIGKIVKSFAEEGIAKLEEVVKAVHENVKEIFEGISEKDIHNVIAGEYNEKRKPLSELNIRMKDLADEAKLVNKYEALLNGEEPKTEKAKIVRNKEITELREKIKAFKDEQHKDGIYTPEETKAKLESIKKRNLAETAKIKEHIAKGEFEKEKKTPFLETTEGKKEFPALYKEVLQSKDELVRARLEREARLLKQEHENRGLLQKAGGAIQEGVDTIRAAQTNPDLSFMGRQGLIYFVTHPIEGSKTWWEAVKQGGSQKKYDRWLDFIHNSPEAWDLIDKSGVAVLDPYTLHRSMLEEQWRSKLIHKIPIVGPVAKASERAFTSGANMARVNLFFEGVNVLRRKGRSFENAPEEYKGWASAVNNITARGGLGKLEPIANYLAIPFWSPRLIASRINLFLNPIYYIKLPPIARMMLIKTMAQYVGTTVGMLAFAKILGVSVETNPRSSDFAKLKIGNSRYDITGGSAQYYRTLFQFFSKSRKSVNTGKVEDLKVRDQLSVPTNFLRGKLSPVWGFALDAQLGENMVGEPVEWKDAYKLVIPMLRNDIADAAKQEGPGSAVAAGLASFLGIGVQTYDASKGKSAAPFQIYDPNINKKRDPTKEEIEKYNQLKEVNSKKLLEYHKAKGVWFNRYGDITTDENEVHEVRPYDKLTKDEIKILESKLAAKAASQSKKEIQPKEEISKGVQETIINEVNKSKITIDKLKNQ